MTNSANRLFDAAAERILLQTWEQYPCMAWRRGWGCMSMTGGCRAYHRWHLRKG